MSSQPFAQFAECLRGVDEEQAEFAPRGEGENAYSMAQVARHVAGSVTVMASRLRAVGMGEEPAPLTGPGSFGGVEAGSMPELIAALQPALSALRDSVKAIADPARLDSTISHPTFGELDCRAYLRLIGLHIKDHVHQVAKTKTDPEYPSS